MKLKDIVPYCIGYIDNPSKLKYYWIINGSNYYQIDKIEGYTGYEKRFISDTEYVATLSQYNNSKNTLTLNLEHEITIFDNIILVHNTDRKLNDDNKLFRSQKHFIDENTRYITEYYVIGLIHPCGEVVKNMRYLFKELINPPVTPKPAELSLDDKLDSLVEDIMKDSKTMAIKKLKRMLNERL